MDPSKPLSAILAKERVAQDQKPLMSEAGLIYTLMEKTEKARCGRVVGWNEGSGRAGGSMGEKVLEGERRGRRVVRV